MTTRHGPTDFAWFARFAQNAERGLTNVASLAEGLRRGEHRGPIRPDVVGRPARFTVLNRRFFLQGSIRAPAPTKSHG